MHERKDALVVPRAAVRYDKRGQHFVFVVEEGKVNRRNISVGVASSSDYEVLGGLNQGDRVVLPGGRTLRNGMDVRPAEAD